MRSSQMLVNSSHTACGGVGIAFARLAHLAVGGLAADGDHDVNRHNVIAARAAPLAI